MPLSACSTPTWHWLGASRADIEAETASGLPPRPPALARGRGQPADPPLSPLRSSGSQPSAPIAITTCMALAPSPGLKVKTSFRVRRGAPAPGAPAATGISGVAIISRDSGISPSMSVGGWSGNSSDADPSSRTSPEPDSTCSGTAPGSASAETLAAGGVEQPLSASRLCGAFMRPREGAPDRLKA